MPDSRAVLIAGAVGAAALFFSRQSKASIAYVLPADYTPADVDDADAGAMARWASRIARSVADSAPFVPTGADYADALPGSPLFDPAGVVVPTWTPWDSDDAAAGFPLFDTSASSSAYANPFFDGGGIMTTASEAVSTGENVAAFLATIRHAEGTADENGYRALYGYRPGGDKVFSDFADHPRVRVKTPWGTTSAAGAYQIQAGTWDEVQGALGLPDFSPESQDRAAVWLIDKRGRALQDIIAGRFGSFVKKLGRIWASLPSSTAGQPKRTLQDLRRLFLSYGGQIDLMDDGATTIYA